MLAAFAETAPEHGGAACGRAGEGGARRGRASSKEKTGAKKPAAREAGPVRGVAGGRRVGGAQSASTHTPRITAAADPGSSCRA
ncbi:hypothetical protein PSP6_10154 [Paraburkholderia tropica]|nr:hypothetical protein PSP6_10154 [Paraburkholderia tropica]